MSAPDTVFDAASEPEGSAVAAPVPVSVWLSVPFTESDADVVALSAELPVASAASGTVDVSAMVIEGGGAVVTVMPSGGCSEPSTSSGLKMVISPLQLEASWLSWQNTGVRWS